MDELEVDDSVTPLDQGPPVSEAFAWALRIEEPYSEENEKCALAVMLHYQDLGGGACMSSPSHYLVSRLPRTCAPFGNSFHLLLSFIAPNFSPSQRVVKIDILTPACVCATQILILPGRYLPVQQPKMTTC